MDTIFLLCDIQVQFRSVIHGYDHVIATTNKMLKFAKLLRIPVLVTTQNVKALGPTDPALDLASLGDLACAPFDKTQFSMMTTEVTELFLLKLSEFQGHSPTKVVLMGIESHVCMLQTVRDLARLKIPDLELYVIADATSSCNSFEVPIALESMRSAGATIITSESFGFLMMRDASAPGFKDFLRIIKEEKDNTKAAGEMLLSHKAA